jgi:hypothetical protein
VIIEGDSAMAIASAADHAINHNGAALVYRDGHQHYLVISDVKLMELMANGTGLTGGITRYRPDGRSACVFDVCGVDALDLG